MPAPEQPEQASANLAPQARAMDMHHIFLILPFLLKELITNEVEENNTRNPVMWIVHPSIMLLCAYIFYIYCILCVK